MTLMCTLSIIKTIILVYVVFNSFSADFQRKKKSCSCIILDGAVEGKAKLWNII